MLTGEAALGRESLAAIDLDGKPRPASSPDAIRVELVSLPGDLPEDERARLSGTEQRAGRMTVPWVELPGDTKRATDAAARARRMTPPKVTLKLEDADEGVFDATRAEMTQPARTTLVPHPPPLPKRTAQPTLAFDADGPPKSPPPPPASSRQPQKTLAFDSGAPALPPLPAKPARR